MKGDPRGIVRHAVDRGLADLEARTPVVVGVSGGADSIALARGVADLGRTGLAVVVDHGLQDDSAAIAEHAAQLCRAVGLGDVRVISVQVATGPGSGGIEAAARAARRAALESVVAEVGAPAVLLGHTREDQAETVLLRLARGSGARSLSAMAPISGVWRRPLLGLPRDVVREAVADLDTWSDPHNADERFARVRVRHTALPALVDAVGAAAVDGLARSADQLRDDADALEAWADQALEQCRVAEAEYDVEALRELPRAVRTRVLRRGALLAGCSPTDLTAEHVDRLEDLVGRWHGQGAVDLPGGICGGRECGRLTFARIPPVAVRRRQREET